MSTFTVQKYTAHHKTQWDQFVARAKNATFLFHRDFMEYHRHRFQDFSLLVFKDGVLFALLPANKVENKVISHQGLTYGSFVLSEKAKFTDAFQAFKSTLRFLDTMNIETLHIRLIPTFYNTMPSDELEYFLYLAKARSVKRDVLMVIDYAHKPRFQKNRREGINRALRNGLQVKVDENFEAFWNQILIPNLSKKHGIKPVHSLGEITQLAARFPKNIKQVNVYHGGKIVAGTTVFITKTTLHPQYVSGNASKNKLGSLDLAYDFIINKLPGKKRYFDFNISSEANGSKLNKGLLFWKETCGARAFTADNYSVKTAAYKNLNLQFT